MFYEIMDWFRQFLIRVVTLIWEMIVISTLTVYYFTETFVLTLTPSFLRTEKSLKGKVVVITGGAGGVGQELALRLARNKARVVVWDINEKGNVIFIFLIILTWVNLPDFLKMNQFEIRI